jgi:hypothetical protein
MDASAHTCRWKAVLKKMYCMYQYINSNGDDHFMVVLIAVDRTLLRRKEDHIVRYEIGIRVFDQDFDGLNGTFW